MTYQQNIAMLKRCQEHYDNLTPPDPDEIPDGCCEEDYEPDDDWDDGYDGCLIDRIEREST